MKGDRAPALVSWPGGQPRSPEAKVALRQFTWQAGLEQWILEALGSLTLGQAVWWATLDPCCLDALLRETHSWGFVTPKFLAR